jgi:hypothetical protein
VARSGVGQRGEAVDLLAALLDVEARQRVLHVLLGADLHAAEGVHGVDHAAEAELDVVVDVDAGQVLDARHQQRRAVDLEGGVDHLRAVAGDLGEGVAGDRHHRAAARAGVQHDDRVGVGAAALAGLERLALLVGEVVGLVGADDEVVGARLVRGAVAAGRRVDLVDPRPVVERDRDEVDEDQEQQQRDEAEPESRAPASLPRSRRRGGGRRAGATGRLATGAALVAAGHGHHPGLVGTAPGPAGLGLDTLRGVALRGLRLGAVEPVVLGRSLLGHPGALRTISHDR